MASGGSALEAALQARVERLESLVWALGACVAAVSVIAVVGPSSSNSGNGLALAWLFYAALMACAMVRS